jgi:tetratricopeptide (TPR) repeat protein
MRILLFLLLLLPCAAQACLNDFVHNEKGDGLVNEELDMLVYKRNFDYKALDKKIAAFESSTKAKTYKDSSDFAVALIKRGYIYRALGILESIAKRMPDDYTIAANLGTCYELVGQNEAALAWIKKGIKLNPQSHEGSEWVHVKILEAKIALAKNPDWLKTNKVLVLPGQIAPVKHQHDKEKEKKDPFTYQKFDSLERHVIYQLRERLPFMSPPDALMAAVLKELAYYEEKTAIDVAILHYTYALEYAGSDDELRAKVRMLNKQLDQLLEKARENPENDGMFNHRSPTLQQQLFGKSKAYKVLDSTVAVVQPLAAAPKTDSMVADSLSAVKPKETTTTTPEKKDSDPGKMWLFIIGGIAIIGGGMWFMRKK